MDANNSLLSLDGVLPTESKAFGARKLLEVYLPGDTKRNQIFKELLLVRKNARTAAI